MVVRQDPVFLWAILQEDRCSFQGEGFDSLFPRFRWRRNEYTHFSLVEKKIVKDAVLGDLYGTCLLVCLRKLPRTFNLRRLGVI